MSIQVQWIHHASFRIQGRDATLYIDPWKLPDSPHDADVIFVSHSHYDHLSPSDIKKISKDDTAIVAPADVIESLRARNAIAPGQSVTIKGLTVEAVAAYNIDKAFHPRGNNWCGAVFTIDGKRIYYAGDTDLVPEMSDLKDVDLALLPVGGTYTLNPAQAAKACAAIGCKAALPYHYGDIVGTADDGRDFAGAAKCKVHLLKPGETVAID